MNEYNGKPLVEGLLDEIQYVYQSDKRPWIIGYSGGKDSTTVVHLVYEMLKRLHPEERNKEVHIVSSDTLVENPLIKKYLDEMLNLLQKSAERDHLPIVVKKVTPDPNNSFWANVIGKGFPTPRVNGTFRWCTDRLKIAPSGKYIENIIQEQKTEVVVLLGVRKAESAARKKRIEGRELLSHLLNRHETIKDAFVYPAIVSLTISLCPMEGKMRGGATILSLLAFTPMQIAVNARLQVSHPKRHNNNLADNQGLAAGFVLSSGRTSL